MQDVDYTIESNDESISFGRRRKRREDPEMDITPMIDITFLLLIFFLVASRLTEEAYVELPRAQNGVAVSNDDSLVVTLTKGSGEDAVIYLGDGAYEDSKLTAAGDEARQEAIERYIEQGLSVGSKQQLLIKAEEGVRHRDVARIARAAGGVETSVLYVAVMEER